MSEPAKLTIEVISEGAVNKGMIITAQFNPKELAVTKSVPWNPNQEAGLDAPVMQFTAGQGEQLKIDLFFDTYEDASNVRDYTSKLRTLSLIDSGIHCPPLLMVTWGGDFSLKCVLESLNIRYTMFLADGTPVRATCSCGFKEALEVMTIRCGRLSHSTQRGCRSGRARTRLTRSSGRCRPREKPTLRPKRVPGKSTPP